MLALGIQYLTGYAVASDVSNREAAEWPPHPARVFMALAAALFETGESVEQRQALEWLEQQPTPAIRASDCQPRAVATHYVPINDSGSPLKGDKPLTPLQTVALGRDRQPRSFPRVRPDDDTVYLLWQKAEPTPAQRAALAELCSNVIRVGHSSSLVQMWLVDEGQEPAPTLVPADVGSQLMRVAGPGVLEYLESSCNVQAIETWSQLQAQFTTARGKAKSALKTKMSELFPQGEPQSSRPTISRWQRYAPVPAEEKRTTAGAFDSSLLVLTLREGPAVGLESTWHLLTALRDTILKTCDPVPEWVSGHRADGSPSQNPHLALLPLSFVTSEHADGHLLGIALAFPRGVPLRERGRALRALFYNADHSPRDIKLHLGSMGGWLLVRDDSTSPPHALKSSTWTQASDTWATATPVVLDRHPKVERSRDRQAWTAEVARIISDSCVRQGLPEPVAVDVDHTSWHRGCPRATGRHGAFPLMPVKAGQPQRQQVHAWLAFDRKIEGPLLLGAGRYRGYGVCKPLGGGDR